MDRDWDPGGSSVKLNCGSVGSFGCALQAMLASSRFKGGSERVFCRPPRPHPPTYHVIKATGAVPATPAKLTDSPDA